jgi:hypothetical protein
MSQKKTVLAQLWPEHRVKFENAPEKARRLSNAPEQADRTSMNTQFVSKKYGSNRPVRRVKEKSDPGKVAL